MPDHEPWWHRGECRDVDPAIFDAKHKADLHRAVPWEEARHLCAICPVQKECLEYVLSVPSRQGDERYYAAGYKPAQLRRMRIERSGHIKR